MVNTGYRGSCTIFNLLKDIVRNQSARSKPPNFASFDFCKFPAKRCKKSLFCLYLRNHALRGNGNDYQICSTSKGGTNDACCNVLRWLVNFLWIFIDFGGQGGEIDPHAAPHGTNLWVRDLNWCFCTPLSEKHRRQTFSSKVNHLPLFRPTKKEWGNFPLFPPRGQGGPRRGSTPM